MLKKKKGRCREKKIKVGGEKKKDIEWISINRK